MEGEDAGNIDVSMSYDLRAYHANLCGTILIKIQEAIEQDNLALLFKLITENLYTEIQQKLDEDEIKDYWKKLNGYIDEKTKLKVEGILEVIEKNPYDYNNNTGDVKKRTKIKFMILNLLWYVRKIMEDNKMFGRKWDDDGL